MCCSVYQWSRARVKVASGAAARKDVMSTAIAEAVTPTPGAEATPMPSTAATEPPEANTPLTAPSAAAVVE